MKDESHQNRYANRYGTSEVIKARRKHALKLGAVSFLVFPFFILLFYLGALAANSNGTRVPLKPVGVLALFTLAGIGNFWQRKYKIGMEQMAGAIAIGTTLSLITTLAVWVILAESS